MTEENKKTGDVHVTKGFTRWVHHHRTLAKWLFKLLIAGVTAILYYLNRQEKQIENEEKRER